jgi:molybdopterin converting factor small subunit
MLQPLAGGFAAVEANGETLRAVLDDLERQFPGLGERIIEAGAIRADVILAVGTDEVRDLDTLIPSDTEVYIAPAIAGG